MDFVVNKVLVGIMSRYLSYYLLNLPKDAFKVELMKGKVTMKGMDINPQFLKDTVVLPNLEIKKCTCNEITITIPWSKLTTEPIVFEMDQVEVVIQEIPFDPDYVPEVPKKKKPKSYGFVGKCMDGIKVHINEVRTSVQLNGYRDNLTIAYAVTKGIDVFSCNSDWEPVDLKTSFESDAKRSEILFYKVCQCASHTVSFTQRSWEHKALIMKDIPVVIKAKVLKDLQDGHIIAGKFDILSDFVEVTLSDMQWKGLLEAAKSLIACFTRSDQRYLFYREIGSSKSTLKSKLFSSFSKPTSSSTQTTTNSSNQSFDEDYEVTDAPFDSEEINISKEDLSIFTQTTFSLKVVRGVLNMLNESDANTSNPSKDAFARVYGEDVIFTVNLPPNQAVPPDNKWSEEKPRKQLCEAGFYIKHYAIVAQEKSGDKIKELVLLTDGRSKTLTKGIGEANGKSVIQSQKKKNKETERRRKKKSMKTARSVDGSGISDYSAASESGTEPTGSSKSKKQKQKKKEKIQEEIFYDAEEFDFGDSVRIEPKPSSSTDMNQLPILAASWTVFTSSPSERDMSKWLKSLLLVLKIHINYSQVIMFNSWWNRLVQFLETTSIGGHDFNAMSKVKFIISANFKKSTIHFPVYSFDKLVVPTWDELRKKPVWKVEIENIKLGKNAIKGYRNVSNLFKDTRMLVPNFMIKNQHELSNNNNASPVRGTGTSTATTTSASTSDISKPNKANRKLSHLSKKKRASEPQISPRGSEKRRQKKYGFKMVKSAKKFKNVTHLIKPQRYQFKFEGIEISLNGKIVVPYLEAYCLELVFHRFEQKDSLYLEILSFVNKLDINVSKKEQYLAFTHMIEGMWSKLWEQMISIILRRYGSDAIQSVLNKVEGKDDASGNPLVVDSQSFWREIRLRVKEIAEVEMKGLVNLCTNRKSWKHGKSDKNCYVREIKVERTKEEGDKEQEEEEDVVSAGKLEKKVVGKKGYRGEKVVVEKLVGQATEKDLELLMDWLVEKNEDMLKEWRDVQHGEQSEVSPRSAKEEGGVYVEILEMELDGEVMKNPSTAVVGVVKDLF